MTDPPFPAPGANQRNGTQSQNQAALPEPMLPASMAERLPQSPVPRPTPTETLSPGVKRDLRRAFLILLGTGLAIGILTATGIVLVMNHFNLIGVPEQTTP